MSIFERFRALPPVGQLALAAVTALLIAALLGGSWLMMRPKYEVLFRDLRPADAATIVAQLDKENLPYRLEDGGAVILAPAGRIDETRLAILGADLPLKGTVGFELFNKSDMGLTEFAQRINYQRALQGELARTIMTIETVDSARVHLTLPEPSIFRADRKPAEASVTLVPRPGRILTPETVAGVQRLIAASAPDLDVANVVVLDAQGALMAGAAPSLEGATSFVSASLQQSRAIEQYYAAGLRRVLEPLYPDIAIAVLVPADQWAAGGEVLRDERLSRWAPGRRDFRLQVNISAPGGLDEQERDTIGRLIVEETDWAANRGDVLLFSDRLPSETPAAAVPPPAASVASASPTNPRLTPVADFQTFAWAAAVLIAAGLLVLTILRRRRGGGLSARERDAYVRRLRRLLAEDAGHAG